MPTDIPQHHHPVKAQLSVKFVIVGSSLAGVACAYALRRAGHQVLVLEQSDGKYRSHGAIRSPPNMTRLLNEWGLGHTLSKLGVKCSQFTFLIGETGEQIGLLKLHQQLMKALRADFYFVQHGDVHSLFFDLASQAGVEFQFNTEVVAVDARNATVRLADGTTRSGDVVVGADGYSSVVRPVILGSNPFPGTADKRISMNVTVPTELMKQDPELLPLTDSSEWTIWMGDDSSVYGYLVSSKREYGLIIHLPAQDDPFGEHWDDHYPIDNLNLNFDSFEPRVRKLMKLARSVTPTKHVVRTPMENWVHDSGKAVLIGEAAHPLMPNGTHNAAMAIEDAVTLGNLFSRVRRKEQIPLLMSAYEEIRQTRCGVVQHSEPQKRDFISLPHGKDQQVRDEGLREAMEHALIDWDDADEDFLRETWEEYIDLFAYDANEVVDDWWTKWGGLLERGVSQDASRRLSPLRYEVSIRKELQGIRV